MGLLVGVYAFWGPPWPTEPTFTPGAASFASPFAVPFSITNKSAVFELNNLKIKCGIASQIEGERPAGGTMVFGRRGNPIYVQTDGAPNRLKAGETRSYTCALAMLRFSVGPNPNILFAEMIFESEYDSPWPWGARTISKSPAFTLDLATMPPQWKPAPLN
jgi:hypothetical protein